MTINLLLQQILKAPVWLLYRIGFIWSVVGDLLAALLAPKRQQCASMEERTSDACFQFGLLFISHVSHTIVFI